MRDWDDQTNRHEYDTQSEYHVWYEYDKYTNKIYFEKISLQ